MTTPDERPMTAKRQQTDYNKLVGVIDGDYYFLDYTFDHGDFKGATATVLRPVPKDEWEDRNDPDNLREEYREHWQSAVERGDTDEGLEDWMEYNDAAPYFDDSGSQHWDTLRELGISEEEYPVIECVGGGRSFSKNMKFDKVYAPELVKVIDQFELEEKN